MHQNSNGSNVIFLRLGINSVFGHFFLQFVLVWTWEITWPIYHLDTTRRPLQLTQPSKYSSSKSYHSITKKYFIFKRNSVFVYLLNLIFFRLRGCEITRRCYVVRIYSVHGQYSALHSQIVGIGTFIFFFKICNYFKANGRLRRSLALR